MIFGDKAEFSLTEDSVGMFDDEIRFIVNDPL